MFSFLGVEFAAELRDFVKDDLQRYYPSELVEKAQITLVDGLDKILNTFSEEVILCCCFIFQIFRTFFVYLRD